MDSIKIIIMSTWIGFNVLQSIKSDEEIFLVGNKRCITNGTAALTIIKKISDTDLFKDNKLSSYYPTSKSECNFEKTSRCAEKYLWSKYDWKICQAMDGPVEHYVTDRRWEDFLIYSSDSKIGHVLGLSINQFKNFKIPLSVRIERNGFVQISLCDYGFLSGYYNCYCILLHETESAIWKCDKLSELDILNYPSGSCWKLDSVDIQKNFESFSEDVWTHISIVRKDGMIKVLRGNGIFMEYLDDGMIYNSKSLLLYSQKRSLWKVHDYHYLFSETIDGKNNPIGPGIKISKDTTCISMFVALCKTCCLRITIILNGEDGRHDQLQKKMLPQNETWTEEKIIVDTQKYVDGTLDISQYRYQCDAGSTSQGQFWAIDDVRQCQEKEYRYIESDEEKFTCQKIGNGHDDIFKIGDNSIATTRVDCPENTFGKFCVPCSIFGKIYCGDFVYCDKDYSGEDCHCTAGSEGPNCRKECTKGFYGHGCQKLCSEHCLGGCTRILGNCVRGCKEPYEPNKCEKPKFVLFVYPPNVTDITPVSGIVRIENFATEAPADTKKQPEYYNIEYGEDSNQDMNITRTGRSQIPLEWKVRKNHMKFEIDKEIQIDGLMPDTYYLVRATVPDGLKDNYIKPTRFITTCTDLNDEDITVSTTNVSASIQIKWPPNQCRFERYQLVCNNMVYNINSSNPLVWKSRNPYTEYECTIRNIITQKRVVKKFRTKEGVPSKVKDFMIEAKANSISLNWKEPEFKGGNIINYTIFYSYVRSKEPSCPYVYVTLNESTTRTYKTLVGLKYYSKYQIMIYAVTNGGQGAGETREIETNQLENISDDEILGIDTYEVSSDSVKISVTKIDCEDLKGPISLQGNASCIHEWCSERNVTMSKYSVDSPFITLTELFPYSNYTAYLAISRDQNSWMNVGHVEFQTKPSAPNRISHLEAISKNSTSISLRWKEPYPPTGVLKEYHIYTHSQYNHFSEDISPKSCSLWKDYHCGILTKGAFYDGFLYTIQISARNEIPLYYGPYSEISVKISKEPSQPTYDISLLWDEKNDLHISWYHPNVTNARLTSFEIELKKDADEIQPPIKLAYKLSSEDDYNLTYTATVASAQLQACTKYKASIKVHNVNKESNFEHASATSPPDISPNIPIGNFEIDKSNSTITVYVPSIENRTSTLYDQKIYILVSKAAETEDLVLFEENLKRMEGIPDMKTSWIVYASNRTNSSLHFKIGDDNQPESSFENRPLEPGTNYSVSIIMSNECFGVMRLRRAQKYISTLENMSGTGKNTNDLPGPEESNGGLWALILLFLVPLIVFGYWYKKNKHPKRSDLLIPHERTNESIALPRLPNPAGKALSTKPKRSLPQALPPLNTTHSKPIRISDFEEYVKGVVTSGELNRQHSLFPRGLVKPCEYGSLAENKAKNRYKNLIAYDETRVKLQKMRGDQYSDYINANYIDGYKKPRCYIATQGPKANTLADFWRMIWQEKVKNIVMLANVYENGKKKVEKYWPDINEDLTFGNVRVQHVSADIFANYDIRVFTVHCNNEERKINQLHFTTWPDHGVPLYSQSLVPFLQRVLKIPYNPQSPIVVHCSAGVGRTGTIILSDICLRMAAGEGSIDFLAYLENIRSQRANLVDNIEQYKLAHLVVLECLFGLHTAVPCNEQMKKIVEGILIDDGIQRQMKYIAETQWQDSAMETMLEHENVLPNYPEKNRFKEIVPQHYRVFLSKYPVDNDASFYINAVQVDGFRNPGRFISTQQPMPNTLGDFWRMVVERSCTTIISLNMLNLKDKTVCKFWPGNEEELNPLDIIRVQHIKTKRLECYKVITVQVKYIKEEPLTVDILEMDNWKSNELLPNSIEEFLAFLNASEAISRNSEHVIVTCYDGATASGLYLAMTFLIEKMKLEQECDVCLAVRTIRHSRKEFVTKEEQYEFLYRASVTFIAGFQSYANFT